MLSDGERISRAAGRGGLSHSTTRSGANAEAPVDPVIEGCPWGASILGAHAVWFLCDTSLPSTLPDVLLYWMVVANMCGS